MYLNKKLNFGDIQLFYDKENNLYFPAIAHTTNNAISCTYMVCDIIAYANSDIRAISKSELDDTDRYLFCGTIFSAKQIIENYEQNIDSLIIDFHEIESLNYFGNNKLGLRSFMLSKESFIEEAMSDDRFYNTTYDEGSKITISYSDMTYTSCTVRLSKNSKSESIRIPIGFISIDTRLNDKPKTLFTSAALVAQRMNDARIKPGTFTIDSTYTNVLRGLRLNDLGFIIDPIPYTKAELDRQIKALESNIDIHLVEAAKLTQNVVTDSDSFNNTLSTNSSIDITSINKGKKAKAMTTTPKSLKLAATSAVNKNKDAAIIVAKIQSGDAALQIVTNRLKDFVPEQYKEMFGIYANTPIGKLLIANLLAVLQSQFVQGNEKAEFITEGAIIVAMNSLASQLPLQKMVVDLFSGIQVPNLVEQQ